MEWNIMWHQALTGSLLNGLFLQKEQTAGFKVPITQNGTRVRLRLSNFYGKKPCQIGGICAIYENILHPITVHGQNSFEIPINTSLYTDELDLPVKNKSELELRIFYKNKFKTANNIEEGTVLYNGNATQSIAADPLPRKEFETTYGMFKMIPAIECVEILSEEQQKTIVAFGDSITAMNRWVKPLAERVNAAYGSAFTVVNSGISGNCLTYEVSGFFSESYGKMGTRRYQRDVLEIPHVHTVIMAFGINDISYMTAKNSNAVNEKLLIEETTRLVEIFHSKGIRVVCQTLGLRKGSRGFTDDMESIRTRYNEWVRTCGLFDYIVDVEPRLLEPGTTDTYKSDLHQGDFLHPNKKGGQVMADCYDLEKLTGKTTKQ